MSDIFISYRRGAASPYARGIYERLVKEFGADRVFMDIDTMEPGVDFVEYIQTAVGTCRVLIVLIGPDWLATVDDTGRRRLDDPEDFVRVEVKAAFERGEVRVIPVLVGGATPPKKADLPPDLAPLTRRQALEITDGRWDYDLGVLMKTINRVFADDEPPRKGPDPAKAEPPADAPARGRAEAVDRPAKESGLKGSARVAIAGVILVAVVVAAVLIASGGKDEGGDTGSASASPASAEIPKTCKPSQDSFLVTDNGADVGYDCNDLPTTLPAGDLRDPGLQYGLYGSPAEARTGFYGARKFEYDKNGASSCPKSARRRMQDVLGKGEIACFVNDDELIMLWWHAEGSPHMGVLSFDASAKPATAVEAWRRVYAAG